jgi:hypothetical protein
MEMFLGIGYLALSLIVAFAGQLKKIGFGYSFAASILFTPFIGIIVVFVSESAALLSEQNKLLSNFIKQTQS